MARRRAGRVAYAALAALVVVLGVEGLLRLRTRLFPPPPYAPNSPWLVADPVAGHRNQPGFADPARGIAINRLGLRGSDVPPAKPTGRLRILCLGDSTTFGVWRNDVFEIRYDTSYPAELDALLRERGYARAEVLNAGVMGYTTAHALRLLLSRLRPLAPDVVTIRLGNNDHTLTGFQPWWLSVTTPYDLLRALPAHAFDWQIVQTSVDGYQRLTGPRATLQPTYKVPIDEFERNVGRLIASVRALGARPMLLDFPYRPIGQGEWRGEPLPNPTTDARNLEELHAIHARYQAVAARVARASGVPFVATEAALRSSPERTFTDFDNSHPNAAGLRATALAIFDALVDLGWLEPARGARSVTAPPIGGTRVSHGASLQVDGRSS
jgi:lysophospholipase L1-like esterase